MKKVYVVFMKDEKGDIQIDSIRTNESIARAYANIQRQMGNTVAVEAVALNEIAALRVNHHNDVTFVKLTEAPEELR